MVLYLTGDSNLKKIQHMSNTPNVTRFGYGSWRIDSPEVESWVNVPEVKGHKHGKMTKWTFLVLKALDKYTQFVCIGQPSKIQM